MADENELEQEEGQEQDGEPEEAPAESGERTEMLLPGETPNRDGAEDGDPPPPERPQAKSEKDIEKGLEALGREAARHAKRVGEIMEEDAQALLRCELCEPIIPGFRWPQVPEDRRAAVMLAIGFDPEPDYEPDDQSSRCPGCKGEGLRATGSKVQGQQALPCKQCNGDGWVGPRKSGLIPSGPPAATAPPVNGPQPEPVSDPERDAAKRAAEQAGFMVIDTRTPAAT